MIVIRRDEAPLAYDLAAAGAALPAEVERVVRLALLEQGWQTQDALSPAVRASTLREIRRALMQAAGEVAPAAERRHASDEAATAAGSEAQRRIVDQLNS